MNDSKKIRVLSGFVPFLRLLNAYISDNFRQSGWRRILESIFYAMCASVMITSLPFVGCSIVWLLIENDMEWIKCVVCTIVIQFSANGFNMCRNDDKESLHKCDD